MAIFEKTEYWGLKDPLEVRVQHGTCIYMGDTFSSHFEPKKFNRVGRRGQKQPKWGYFGTSKHTSNGPIWLKQIYRDIKFILRGLPGRCVYNVYIVYNVCKNLNVLLQCLHWKQSTLYPHPTCALAHYIHTIVFSHNHLVQAERFAFNV